MGLGIMAANRPESEGGLCNSKSVLSRVRISYMLVLHLCFDMVVSQHVVDTRQLLYKYMIYENCVATGLIIL